MNEHWGAPSYPHPRRMRIGWEATKLNLGIEATQWI